MIKKARCKNDWYWKIRRIFYSLKYTEIEKVWNSVLKIWAELKLEAILINTVESWIKSSCITFSYQNSNYIFTIPVQFFYCEALHHYFEIQKNFTRLLININDVNYWSFGNHDDLTPFFPLLKTYFLYAFVQIIQLLNIFLFQTKYLSPFLSVTNYHNCTIIIWFHFELWIIDLNFSKHLSVSANHSFIIY